MRNKNRIVVSNSKGGVGKTTSVIEICAAAARLNIGKGLVIDLDPQGNASRHLLGEVPKPKDETVYDLLMEEDTDIKSVLKKANASWPNVWVIPANQRLKNADKTLESIPHWIDLLDEIVEQIESKFAYIIIDTPPAMNALTKMAVKAANKLLIPTDGSLYSDDGDKTILALVETLKKRTNHHLDLVKMVMTQQQKAGAHAVRHAMNALKSNYEDVFDPVRLPHSVKVNEAQRLHTPPVSPSYILPDDHSLRTGYEKITNDLLK